MPQRPPAQQILARYRPLVDRAIGLRLEGRSRGGLRGIIRYHLGYADAQGRPTAATTGKRIRSTLCLLACDAVGGDPAAAAPAGAAIELLHSFTLLHDDIMDQDDVRHGRPAAWTVWGAGPATTAGDAMHALANLAMAGLTDAGVPAETVVAVLQDLNQAALHVCEGQQLDLTYEGRADLTQDDYLVMIGLKTAALVRAALEIGARIGGAGRAAREALGSFGAAMGLAYQVRDDVLGLWGDPGRLGKPVGSDLRQNKRSLPIILALSQGSPGLRSALAAALARGVADEEEAAALAARIEAEGIRAGCEEMAGRQSARALETLQGVELREDAAGDLRALAGYLVERTE